MFRAYGAFLLVGVLPVPAAAQDLVLESVPIDAAAQGLDWAHACPRSTVCFHATTAEEGSEPWVVRDGKAEMLADLRPGPEGSNPSGFLMDGDVAWFSATVAKGRTHLFRYDGRRLTLGALVPDWVGEVVPLPRIRADGAVHFLLRARLNPEDPGEVPEAMIGRVGPRGLTLLGIRARIRSFVYDLRDVEGFDGGLWLTGVEEGLGTLWFFDGRALSVVYQSAPGGRIERARAAGKYLLFQEASRVRNRAQFQLLATDGTRVWPVGGFADGELRFPQGVGSLGDEAYVVAYREDVGGELFHLVDDRLQLVADLNPGTAASQPRYLTEYGGALWFTADDGLRGLEMWRYDGLRVTMVTDFCPGSCSGSPSGYRVVGDSMWFFAKDGVGDSYVWRLGPPRSKRVVVAPSSAPPKPTLDRRRVHRAVDLFAPEGTNPTLALLAGVPHFTSFAAEEQDSGWSLQPWRVSGRTSALVQTTALAADDVGAAGFLEVAGSVWVARRLPEGAQLLSPTGGASIDFLASAPERSLAFGDQSLFLADDAAGRGLFAFDGVRVRRLHDAAGSLQKPPGAVLNGVFYFAGRGLGGTELHAWDGIRVRQVLDLAPGDADGMLDADIVGWRDEVWFVGTPVGEGRELVRWVPGEGATPVVVQPGPEDGAVGTPVIQHDVLWFPGTTEATGRELFVVMSPDAVARLLLDLNPGRRGSDPSDLVAHDQGLYFAANVLGVGRELFRAAGREGEVELVRDLAPGADSSDPSQLVASEGELWFVARTPEGAALHVFSP